MNEEQMMVREFHKTFDLPVSDHPITLSKSAALRRVTVMLEELSEIATALGEGDMEKIIDGLCDLQYFAYGTAVEMGIDLEPCFREVHRSNMTKEGGYKNELGKWVKPDTYEEPKLLPIINSQMRRRTHG